MIEKATILIPDISGFTEFSNRTEIDHSAHIINELLWIIIDSNNTGFIASEIEGDAVLFYKKGEMVSVEEILQQCLRMFSYFHTRLKVIERDRVCQCGACQSATHLSLKFIIHYGDIKEIKVAHFTKPTGLDMIIAHRLLKNDIRSKEYVLVSDQCIHRACNGILPDVYDWKKSTFQYSSLGDIAYYYFRLEEFLKTVPDPPKREKYVVEKGPDQLSIKIESGMFEVFQKLIGLDDRIKWMRGAERINREDVSERVGMRYNCQFPDFTFKMEVLYSDYGEEKSTYVESLRIDEFNIDYTITYELILMDHNHTELSMYIKYTNRSPEEELRENTLNTIADTMEEFKRFCEGTLQQV
jgi:hypothetical protein